MWRCGVRPEVSSWSLALGCWEQTLVWAWKVGESGSRGDDCRGAGRARWRHRQIRGHTYTHQPSVPWYLGRAYYPIRIPSTLAEVVGRCSFVVARCSLVFRSCNLHAQATPSAQRVLLNELSGVGPISSLLSSLKGSIECHMHLPVPTPVLYNSQLYRH